MHHDRWLFTLPLQNVLQSIGDIPDPCTWEATYHLGVSFSTTELPIYSPYNRIPYDYSPSTRFPALLYSRASHSAMILATAAFP
eukprot:g13541.t1